jgi:VWFA-related protein
VVAQGRPRQVVVVVTDGVDTSSTQSASDVSRLASAVDVPVYVIAVVTTLDRPHQATRAPGGTPASAERPLEALAHRTGGLFFVASAPAQASSATRQIAAELHQSYYMAFAPGSQAGWHAITLRPFKKGLLVRARSGYLVDRDQNQQPKSTSER